MIKFALFEDVEDIELKTEINIYLNNRIQEVFRVANDFLNENLRLEDIIDYKTLDFTEKQLLEYYNTTVGIVFSQSFRDYIKPIYKYIIYGVIEWYLESFFEEVDESSVSDTGLMDRIKCYYGEDSPYIISCINDIGRYNDILFDDFDFLSPTIDELVQLYLKNDSFFRIVFSDIELDDYVPIMPRDLKELYSEHKKYKVTDKLVDTFDWNKLNNDLIRICEMLQNDKTTYDASEDQLNDRIRNYLYISEYEVRDQTRTGRSSSGKSAGEADIQIFFNKIPYTIIESLILNGVDKTKLKDHIDKIFKYDTRGNSANYILSFVKVKQFKTFSNNYLKYIEAYEFDPELRKNSTNVYNPISLKIGSEIKVFFNDIERAGENTILFHILVHLQG